MKYFFIINPEAGHPKDPQIYEKAIEKVFRNHQHWIEKTKAPGHAQELTREALSKETIPVAVGGDGTINEVASILVGTKHPLGIIPKGSGCGYATNLKIPRNPTAACKTLLKSKALAVDVGKVNERYFFNIAGIGLDAHVGLGVNTSKRRGIIPYIIHTIKELRSFKPFPMKIESGNMAIETEPLFIAVCLGQQYGLGLKIAPQAKLNDGLFHVTIVNPMTPLKALYWLPCLFTGKLSLCPYISTLTTKSLTVKLPNSRCYHLDGETFQDASHLHFEILPGRLSLLVPPDYRA